MSIQTASLLKAYPPFSSKFTSKKFLIKINALGNEMKWNFVRASLLYQQATKCLKCEPNTSMMLLCSCADSMKVFGKKAGSRKSFLKFYIDYYPQKLQITPIRYYPNGRTPSQPAPFDITLNYIYKKFRCLYIHEGKGRLNSLPSGTKWLSSTLLDKYKNDYYSVNTLRILSWFLNITQESLYQLLVSTNYFYSTLKNLKHLF